jgi:hypothetical protein
LAEKRYLSVVIRRPPEAGICVSKYVRPEGRGIIGAEPLGITRYRVSPNSTWQKKGTYQSSSDDRPKPVFASANT